MKTYESQIVNLCIQTYYNLHGTMPDTKTLIEMLGETYEEVSPEIKSCAA